jgi:hypothetical protein
VHALENLATSDTGIAMLRRIVREQIKRVDDGLDPMNVIREERLNRTIPTNAWNTILSPTEASVLQGEEVLRLSSSCGLNGGKRQCDFDQNEQGTPDSRQSARSWIKPPAFAPGPSVTPASPETPGPAGDRRDAGGVRE